MKKIVLIAAVFWMTASAAQQNQVVLLGSGDCGTWLQARKTNQAKFLEQHLMGLINGMTMGSSIDIWIVGGSTVSAQQLYFWMDNHCQKNPLSNTFAGATDFADERTSGEYKKKITK